ncbi:MAG: HlyC/CorC family transporter [Phycisphaerales bacterium]|nr:HlyC/CorC family transporter [Phycisphaerales bacterium]
MPLVYEILIIFGLIVLNGLLAMSELAIVSARKARLREMANAGDRRAESALRLRAMPERFLSTVQIGITLVGVFAGAYGGATIAGKLADALQESPSVAPLAEPLSIGIVVVAITYVSLVIGELVPKRLAMSHPERIACRAAPYMHVLSALAAPLVSLLSASTKLVFWLARMRPSTESPVTEEELRILLDQGRQAGVFEKAEQDIVERVLRLGDRRVSSLMTPRTELVWVDPDDPIGESMRTMIRAGHTYYPVCRGNIEHVLGVTSIKAQIARMVNKNPPNVLAEIQPPLFVPEAAPALKVLETFKQTGQHHALCVDEYGGVSGMVTLNDIMEAVVGDVMSAGRTDEKPAVRRPDGSWLMAGWLPVADVVDLLNIEVPEEAEPRKADTLGGLIIAALGDLPKEADAITWCGYRFEVVDMDGKRVDKVLVQPVLEPQGGEPGDSQPT